MLHCVGCRRRNESNSDGSNIVKRISSLWPIHYKPFPDELLSCWLVRLAHGHGMKSQTFCNVIFGNRRQIWNRDIDRLAPPWLLDELTNRTGTLPSVVLNTTLRSYEGRLYHQFRSAGPLHWILLLQMYHRKRKGFGLQFCPTCLLQDTSPYFRKQWRVALNTVCIRHGTMLMDRCPECLAAIAVHRLDMRLNDSDEMSSLSLCHACGFDLKNARTTEPIQMDVAVSKKLLEVNRLLISSDYESADSKWELPNYGVLHQLCKIMTTKNPHVTLRCFVQQSLGMSDIALTNNISFEMRPIEERHHLLQLSMWILLDLPARLSAAWKAKAVRYNILLKDFDNPPDWYINEVNVLSNWRNRLS